MCPLANLLHHPVLCICSGMPIMLNLSRRQIMPQRSRRTMVECLVVLVFCNALLFVPLLSGLIRNWVCCKMLSLLPSHMVSTLDTSLCMDAVFSAMISLCLNTTSAPIALYVSVFG
ncbi:unnamed protein product [Effrenium voratum]|uniref:Uncharacterized protein n=1 Tax=Effrenium voratum TaxID=2562239 RepID=A0AA36N712_9DINO|nr:unnamed protein product [Effrenium voratum]